MKKSLISSFILLFTLTALLSACSSNSKTESSAPASSAATTGAQSDSKFGGEINVAVMASPPSLDVMFTAQIATNMPMLHVYEALTTYDDKSNIIPQLASSWDVDPEYKEFTFHLRKGVLFHNGNEMTADDIKASLERFVKIGVRKSIFAELNRFEVVDPYTFKVVFNKPYATFLPDLTNPFPAVVIMPRELKDIEGGKLADDQIIGTGPYQFDGYQPDQYIHLKKFDKYVPDKNVPASGFGGERIAYLDRINFMIVPEKASRLNGLLTGDYDYAEGLDATAYDKIESDSNVRPDIVRPGNKLLEWVNTISGPFSNPKLRDAARLATDDEAILLAASGKKTLYEVDHSLFYPGQTWFSDIGKDKYNQKNIEAAKALVKESGYNGEEIVYLTTKEYDWMYQSAVVVQSQLQAIGLNVKLKVLDWPSVVSHFSSEKWKDFSLVSDGLIYPFDPTFFNPIFTGGRIPIKSADLEQTLKVGFETAVFEERKAAYDKMMEVIYRDSLLLIHGDVNSLNGSSKKLMGEKTWYMLRFWNVWKDK